MQTPDYIILTPTAPFKLYCFNRFMENVLSFQPKPKEVVFCTEPEMVPEIAKWKQKLKKQGIKLVIFTLEPEILNQFPKPDIKKLTYSREHLRKYFINSPFEWALWLDSDIIPEPNVFRVLLKVALSEKYLVVSNEYPARLDKECIIRGMGCTLTHKAACMFARFMNTPFIWNGQEAGWHLIDDFWFFVMVSGADWYIKKSTGWNSCGKRVRAVSIWHLTGSDKFPNKFLKKDSHYNK